MGWANAGAGVLAGHMPQDSRGAVRHAFGEAATRAQLEQSRCRSTDLRRSSSWSGFCDVGTNDTRRDTHTARQPRATSPGLPVAAPDRSGWIPVGYGSFARSARNSSLGCTSRAAAISNKRSNSRPRCPSSTLIRTLRVTPDRSASASCVSPRSTRNERILPPTALRYLTHAATRSGSFWLGRVGTPTSNGAQDGKVCPTSSTLLERDRLLVRFGRGDGFAPCAGPPR